MKLIKHPFPIVCQHCLNEGNEHSYEDGQNPYCYVSLNNRVTDSGKENHGADEKHSGEARIVLFQKRRKKECCYCIPLSPIVFLIVVEGEVATYSLNAFFFTLYEGYNPVEFRPQRKKYGFPDLGSFILGDILAIIAGTV